ncbi:WbqC family protein [candidate division KSB1 bacterium]
MIAAIQQPDFLPDLAYFDRIYRADVTVFLDTIKLPKRDTVNRARVLGQSGAGWFIVPLKRGGRMGQRICDAEIDYSKNWHKKQLVQLHHTYKNTPYFDDIFPFVQEIIESKPHYITELNIPLITGISERLQLAAAFMKTSGLSASGTGSQLLIDIVGKADCETLLVPAYAKNFIDQAAFDNAGIRIEYHNFKGIEYNQYRPGFTPGLSIFDVMCHCSRRTVHSFLAGR